MFVELFILVLLLIIVILYLYFNRSTLIPVDIPLYSHVDSDNMLHIPIVKGV